MDFLRTSNEVHIQPVSTPTREPFVIKFLENKNGTDNSNNPKGGTNNDLYKREKQIKIEYNIIVRYISIPADFTPPLQLQIKPDSNWCHISSDVLPVILSTIIGNDNIYIYKSSPVHAVSDTNKPLTVTILNLTHKDLDFNILVTAKLF